LVLFLLMSAVSPFTDQTSLEHLVIEFRDQLGLTLRITPVEPRLPLGEVRSGSAPAGQTPPHGLILERFRSYDKSPSESVLPPLDLIWRARRQRLERLERQERRRLRLLQAASTLCLAATLLAAAAMVVSLLLS